MIVCSNEGRLKDQSNLIPAILRLCLEFISVFKLSLLSWNWGMI